MEKTTLTWAELSDLKELLEIAESLWSKNVQNSRTELNDMIIEFDRKKITLDKKGDKNETASSKNS